MYLPQESNFTPPPEGTHVAVCYRFIDLGTQDTEYKGTPKRSHKVLIGWELSDEFMEDGRPFIVNQNYTWSMSDKALLRNHLEAWRGRKFTKDDFEGPNRFDVKNIIGAACLLTIVHEDKGGSTYANIKSVSALPKGMQKPAPVNTPVYLALSADRFNAEAFEGLSEKLREKIKRSPEYMSLNDPRDPAPSPDDYGADLHDDPIPF